MIFIRNMSDGDFSRPEKARRAEWGRRRNNMAELGGIRDDSGAPRGSRQLVQQFFRQGLGRHQPGKPCGTRWETTQIRAALVKAKQEIGNQATAKIPSNDTIRNWVNGETTVELQSRELVRRIFFGPPPWGDPLPDALQELQNAWERERAQPKAKSAQYLQSASASEVEAQPWTIFGHDQVEGLVELTLQQPRAENEAGSYRVYADVRLDVATPYVPSQPRRKFSVGLRKVFLALESRHYRIKSGSMVGDRPIEMPAVRRASGVEFSGPIDTASGCINADLLGEEHLTVIESNNDGEGPVTLSVRAERDSFRFSEFDDQRRRVPVELTDEQDAVLVALLRSTREPDGLGRVLLAKHSMRRKSE